ncbi:helicase-like transcription factor [Fusarium albosuccineum]|uniref:Helicase-like transcription factor n=1 Tax=Fusarium albosuccineum TaxID=1237068 RepID=A0A8H4NZ68_9HYPO|nr:helicase-like transcription factor [Fusarium albosuccineum]
MSNLKRLLNPVDEDEDVPSDPAFPTINYDNAPAYNANFSTNWNGYYNGDYNGELPRVSDQLGVELMSQFSEVPIMQGIEAFDPILNPLNFDVEGIDPQDMVNMTLGDEVTYWQDPNLNEFPDTQMSLNNSYETLSSSDPSTSTSHEGSQTPSAGAIPSQSSAESPTQSEDDDAEVCYGMLHNLEVKLIGDMPSIDERLRAGDPMQHFVLKEHQDHAMIRFPDDDKEFGYLRSAEGKALKPLVTQQNVSLEPLALKPTLRDIIERAARPADAMVKVDINVYGPRSEASRVGKTLSQGKLWLQRPDHSRDNTAYENPQFLRIEFEGGEIQPLLPIEHVTNNGALRKKTREEQLRKMVEEVYKSVDNSRGFDLVDGGSRVTQQLLKHQQEALGFMLERESGNISDRYRLWREVTLDDGTTQYRHKITKAKRRTRPEEKGGGILADEMGMGKSLSILALVMKTMEDGEKWAKEQNNEHKGKKSVKWSHSTLVIVSAALLIDNWMNEIRKHLQEGLKVIKYHGSGRKKELADLEESDIVVTTYHTLSAEHQVNKGKTSPLHQIGWYRVVLDEAHIIRRPSTTFYKACHDLRANSRWCLTGTPIQNKLADIGTLFSFIRAEPFDRPSIFRRWIEGAFEQSEDEPELVRDRLVTLLEALCLRRTREVLHLPSTRQFIRTLEFSPEEKEQYEKTQKILLRSIKHRVGEVEKSSKFGLFQMKLQLRILCNHGTYQKLFSWHRRSLLDEKEALMGAAYGRHGEISCAGCQQPMPVLGSSWAEKMFDDQCSHILCSECIAESSTSTSVTSQRRCPVCVKWHQNVGSSGGQNKKASVEDDHEHYFNTEGHSTKMKALVEDVARDLWKTKSIIFSCWTRTLYLVSRHLDRAQIPYLQVDGDCPLPQRQAKLDQFAEDDDMPVLIMTTGTGAFGLNLTCANRIFIAELQWNPSVENQAIARAIRLGQESEVRVMRYVIKDTVEEEMRQQQQYKKTIAAFGFEEVPEVIDMDMQEF